MHAVRIDRAKRLGEEPGCGHNRFHPDIAPVIEVGEGEEVALETRDALDGQLKPGATVDGPVLIESDMGHQIDNMEGIAVHRAADGKLVLTLIPDDNFSLIQRTILLQFGLTEP